MSVRDTLKKSRAKVHPLEISTGTVYVKAFNGHTRHQYTEMSREKNFQLPLHTTAALALCEEDGSLLFDVSTEKGVALANLELQEVESTDLQKIVLELFKVSGLAKDSVSDAEKKSEASPSA